MGISIFYNTLKSLEWGGTYRSISISNSNIPKLKLWSGDAHERKYKEEENVRGRKEVIFYRFRKE